MPASSVAANSDDWIVPLLSLLDRVNGAVSMRVENPETVFSTTRRLNIPLSSVLQRAYNLSNALSSETSARTLRPARPNNDCRTSSLERK